MALSRSLCLVCLLATLACDPPASTTTEGTEATSTGGTTASASTADPSRWPRDFVAGPGTGPALFLHQGSDAPALGYVSEGVPFKIAGLPENGRIPVRIAAGLKVRAWLSTSRLAQRVQRRGKISGTAAYVGPGDYVRILGPAEDPERMRVEVMARLGDGVFAPAVSGEFPTIGLSHEEPPADAEAPSTGETRYAPAGEEITLYARPGGDVVATLPGMTPGVRLEVLRERREWKGVRAGLGPYLIGYTNASLTEEGGETTQDEPEGDLPMRLQAEADKPLWRLAEGTRVRFDGRTVAILDAEGWGREMNRYENSGEVDLFVAVDDRIAVRGMVRIRDLQPVDGEQAPTPPAQPAEPAAGDTGTTAPTP